MQNIFSAALSSAVSKHIELSPTRRETLAWLALMVATGQKILIKGSCKLGHLFVLVVRMLDVLAG